MDTNVIIEFLGGRLPTTGSNWMQQLVENSSQYLSVINKIELLGYNGSPLEMQTLEAFIESNQVLELTDLVVQKTIELRKIYRIKLPDAIIAATVLVYNLTLITRQYRRF